MNFKVILKKSNGFSVISYEFEAISLSDTTDFEKSPVIRPLADVHKQIKTIYLALKMRIHYSTLL